MTSYETTITGSDVPHVPEGTYLAVLEGSELAKTRFGEARKWHWTLPAADNFELSQLTSLATTGGSNGGRIIKALLGRTLGPKETLPTAEMRGKSATLVLSIDTESGWNRVEEVHPAATPLSQADAEEPKPGSTAHMQERLARLQAEAQAATFTAADDLGF